MITPRDVSLVIDLSGSMSDDSELRNKDVVQINLRDIWVTLDGPDGSPNTKYIDGKGTFITDYELHAPDDSVYANRDGQSFGSMTDWGTTINHGTYNDNAMEADPEIATAIQEDLMELKLYSGPADGDYGPGTLKAVEGLQAKCEIEVDGRFTPYTHVCLEQEMGRA